MATPNTDIITVNLFVAKKPGTKGYSCISETIKKPQALVGRYPGKGLKIYKCLTSVKFIEYEN